MMQRIFLACAMTATALMGGVAAAAGMDQNVFGTMPDGREVKSFTLTNGNGMRAVLIEYGATLVSLEVPDRAGALGDVVLGFDSVAEYEKGSPYFGCIVGRYANRIGGAKFSLDGKEYTLAKNDKENTLHGGKVGFDKVVWTAEPVEDKRGPAVKFSYTSKDGEEGYPGTLKVNVYYTLSNINSLRIRYEATSDAKTVCNLTHHSYFNLAGAGSGDVLQHELEIAANKFTPVDATLIPTGELRELTGSPLDFRAAKMIGTQIEADDEQIKLGGGYDHNYVLLPVKNPKKPVRLAASVFDPSSGRTMEVLTTEPGLQFYTGNFLDGTLVGKSGKTYVKRGALCLEAQKFPDSPNKPEFPSCVLEPGKTYRQTTVYTFGVRK